MKRILCIFAAIILVISFFDIYSLGYASEDPPVSNNNGSEVPIDGSEEDDDDQSNVEDPENADNTETTDPTTIPSDTNIKQESSEEPKEPEKPKAPSDTTTTEPSSEVVPNKDVESATILPAQQEFKLIDILNEKNMWSNKTVYLTFDDGPSKITEQVLNVLKEKNIKATFFVTGIKTEEGKALLKRIDKEGHSIGNHTYSHKYSYIYKDVNNFFDDLYKNDKVIYEATGKHTKIIRFPGGSNNISSKTEAGKKTMSEILSRLADEGYIYFDWNASSGDASPQPPTVNQIINNVLAWVGKNNNAVVLFHDTATKENTLEALPTILDKLKFLGCNFEILTTNSPHIAFVKANSISNKKPVVLPIHPRKPPYVIRKLQKLEEKYIY